MTLNMWQKTLILNNHNMNVKEIISWKNKKTVETVFIESVKVDLNGFPYKYIKNIAFK